MYCETECIDTVLSIVDQKKAFEELSEEDKEYFRNIEINLNNEVNVLEYGVTMVCILKAYENVGEQNFRTGQAHYKETIDRRSLVGKHPVDGKEYLYPMFIYLYKAWYKGKEIEDFQAFYDKLWSVVTRSKYMVHHVFRKGDLLFMDQLLTSHRRSDVKNKDKTVMENCI